LGGNVKLVIANSTVSGNSAENIGGGIANVGEDSGRADLQIINSTLSANFADATGGSIYNHVYGSGSATVEIGSTILKAGASVANITNYLGTVTSLGYNFSSDDGGGFLNQPTDLINTDPLLGPLQDNGGPTFTHALLPGSPAMDKGTNFAGAATDQRGLGFVRTVDDPSAPNASAGDGTDIGAYEVQQALPPPDSDSDSVPDSVDHCPDTPPGDIVNATGCSLAQLVPCEGPLSGESWKNHGQYVRAVVGTATEFLNNNLITRGQWAQIVTHAARSRCGWNRRWDRDVNQDWHRNWDCDRDADWGRDRDRD